MYQNVRKLQLAMYFYLKLKTAYEKRISDWSLDVCSSDLTGKVKPGVAAPSLVTRFTTTNVPNLRPGEFLVKVSDLSLAKLMGIITTQLEPVSNQLSDLVTTVNDLSGTVDTHTQQIGQLQSQVVGLDNRITSESAATAKQLDRKSVV